ncbi:hypothetical protein LUZ60_001589 [Juncus effusus]|nr:hypothetical protein LUZ60_001589 [Juncus effusus]
MRARVVVFPIKGRNWCFSRSRDPSNLITTPEHPPPSMKDLWEKVTTRGSRPQEKAEACVDFVADKMNLAWSKFEKAPEGSLKSKIHDIGLWLLSQVKPSEIFLKSVSKDVSKLDINYPASLNPRVVRRRLRHIAMRGAAVHRRNFYGSVCLIPATSILSILPLPNIPFFWILFRTYSNYRALQGSERLMLLVSNNSNKSSWVFQPSEKLERIISSKDLEKGLDCETISNICNIFDLEKKEIVKYRKYQ